MHAKLRVGVGVILIVTGITLLFTYNAYNRMTRTYTEQELAADATRRIVQNAGGKGHVRDVQLQVQQSIGHNKVLLYSYHFTNAGEASGYVMYEERDGKYKVKLENRLAAAVSDNQTNAGLHYILSDGYWIVCGIVRDGEPDTYEIRSGQTVIQDVFERDQYFIKEYVLGNPAEVKITPLN
ncbi:hypothetical protein [Paenibacillus sp. y28]|uniref:hypothetical protein n=1 Tax=Paenibacillus sp. y28 TaxID=3129110 RepID=UPI0030165AC8